MRPGDLTAVCQQDQLFQRDIRDAEMSARLELKERRDDADRLPRCVASDRCYVETLSDRLEGGCLRAQYS